MSFKRICEFIKSDQLVEKKILSKEVYYKYLIKKIAKYKYKKNKYAVSLDRFFDYKRGGVLPKFYTKRIKFMRGYSLNIKDYRFKSKLNNACSFKIPYYPSKSFSSNNLQLLVKRFIQRSQSYKKKPTHAFIMKAIKGGYFIFTSTGNKGFLPGSHSTPYYDYFFRQCAKGVYLPYKRYNSKFVLLWMFFRRIKSKFRLPFKNYYRKRRLRKKNSYKYLMLTSNVFLNYTKKKSKRKTNKLSRPSFFIKMKKKLHKFKTRLERKKKRRRRSRKLSLRIS